MAEHLSVYAVHVHPERSSERQPIADIDGKKTKLIDWFATAMAKLMAAGDWLEYNHAAMKCRVQSVQTVDANTVHGIILAGHTGDRFAIGDPNDPDRILHDKARDQTMNFPLYYRLHAPSSGEMAYLITQKSGVYGIKSTFWEADIREQFREDNADRVLELGVLHPRGVAEAYGDDGKLKEIVLTTHHPPTQIASGLRIADADDLDRMEVRFVPKRGRGLKLAQDIVTMLKGEGDMPAMLEMSLGSNGPNYNMDELDVTVKAGGQQRKVTVTTAAAVFKGASYPINPDMDPKTEWPVFESVAREADDLQHWIMGAID